MIEKTFVVISRRKGNPNIEMTVSGEGIAISIALTDFVKALAQEIGNPTMMITNSQLLAKLQVASDIITTDMKNETIRII